MTKQRKLKPKFKIIGMVCTTVQLVATLIFGMLMYYSDAFTKEYKYLVCGVLFLLCYFASFIMRKRSQDLMFLWGLFFSIIETIAIMILIVHLI